MKKFLPVIAVMTLGATMVFAQAQFDDIDNVVKGFDTAGKSILGTGVRWIMGLLPVVLFAVGVFGGIKYSKKQADQDQDNTKMYVTAAIGGIAGTMVGLLLVALIGTALMGEASKGLEVLRTFWSKLVS